MNRVLNKPLNHPLSRRVNRGLLSDVGSQSLPRADLLIYLARPNSDAYITGEDTEIPEDQHDWGYVLPSALFAELGECLFFTASGDPIVVLASEILADPDTNDSHVLFKSQLETQQTGKLAVYDPATDAAVLTKAKKVLGIS